MEFFCVYCKNRKKFDKYVKSCAIKRKYIIDIKRIIEDEEITDYENDKTFVKILILNKINQAIEKKMDIYYLPLFDDSYDFEKLMNLRQIVGRENNFNILIFWNEFQNDKHILSEVIDEMPRFNTSQIIKDF
jgi:hypothetical protein